MEPTQIEELDGPLSFDECYKRYRRAVLKAAHAVLGDWQKAEDVSQNAFMIFHRRNGDGEPIRRPRAFIRTIAHFLAVKVLRAEGRMPQVPTDTETLQELIDRTAGAGWLPEGVEMGGPAPMAQSLVFWGRRMIDVATNGAPPLQRRRLAALMGSGGRTEALESLRAQGDEWAKSAVTMTLVRYSEKIDLHLRERLSAGPQTPEERTHWPFLEKLCRLSPTLGDATPGVHLSTLSWFIAGINRIEPPERQRIVEAIFADLLDGPLPAGDGDGDPPAD
jgi:DNA-directed RNA polymerase specialized sigma24 family protein